MIIENIQQLLEHIETDKKAEELVDYINILQIENKQLKSILTDLEEWLKEEVWNEKYWVLDKITELKEKYK